MSERRRRRAKPQTDIQTAESVKLVRVTPFKDAEELEEVEREVHIFQTDPAFVRVSAGQTINTGDYNSLRVDVALTMPCYVEMADETQQEVATWVANRLQDEIDQYLGEQDD